MEVCGYMIYEWVYFVFGIVIIIHLICDSCNKIDLTATFNKHRSKSYGNENKIYLYYNTFRVSRFGNKS